MNRTINLAIAIILSVLSFHLKVSGQNWECIKTNGDYFFSKSGKINHTISIDTSYVVDGQTHYRNITGLRALDDYCILPEEPSFLGADVYSDSAGVFYFITDDSLEIRIESLAEVGHSWVMFQNNSGAFFRANVENIEEGNVLGHPDSIKIISMQAYNNIGQPVNNGYNDVRIQLSKSFGLINAIDFYLFPEWSPTCSLAGMSNPRSGVNNIGFAEFFDMEIGDEFHIFYSKEDYGGETEIKTIKVLANKSYDSLGRLILNFNKRYTYKYYEYFTGQTTYSTGYSTSTQTVDFNSYFAQQMNKLPGTTMYFTTDSTDIGLSEIRAYNDLKLQKKYDGYPEYYKIAPPCYREDDPGVVRHYIKGCGGPYSSYYEYHNVWGENLVYYRKGNVEWGTPYTIPEDESYWCFRTGETYFYSRVAEKAIVKSEEGIHLISTNSGNKTNLINYTTVRQENDSCFNIQGYSWIGKKIERDNLGNYQVINSKGDTLQFYPMCNVGESFTFYKNGTYQIKATVSEISEQPVLGVTDLIKKITFTALSPDGQPINHPINDEYLLLSKTNGFTRTFSFYDAPDSLVIYELTGKSNGTNFYGIGNIGMSDIYKMSVNDQFHFIRSRNYPEGHSSTGIVRTVLGLEYYPDEIKFTFRDFSKITVYENSTGNTTESFNDTIYTQIIKYAYNGEELFNEMPGESCKINGNGELVVLSKLKVDSAKYNGRVIKYYQTPSYILDFDSCYSKYTDSCSYYYIDGCGGPYKYCIAGGFTEVDSLVYFKKGTEEWGEILDFVYGIDTPSNTPKPSIFPNPANDFITFRFQNLTGVYSLELYTSTGIRVTSLLITGNEILLDLKQLPSGVYFYKLSGDTIDRGKIIVSKN